MIGIIEQWGNGLILIITGIKSYPDIAFLWKERGEKYLQFRKKAYGFSKASDIKPFIPEPEELIAACTQSQ